MEILKKGSLAKASLSYLALAHLYGSSTYTISVASSVGIGTAVSDIYDGPGAMDSARERRIGEIISYAHSSGFNDDCEPFYNNARRAASSVDAKIYKYHDSNLEWAKDAWERDMAGLCVWDNL